MENNEGYMYLQHQQHTTMHYIFILSKMHNQQVDTYISYKGSTLLRD